MPLYAPHHTYSGQNFGCSFWSRSVMLGSHYGERTDQAN